MKHLLHLVCGKLIGMRDTPWSMYETLQKKAVNCRDRSYIIAYNRMPKFEFKILSRHFALANGQILLINLLRGMWPILTFLLLFSNQELFSE